MSLTLDNSNWKFNLADELLSIEHIIKIKSVPLTLSTFAHPFGCLILSFRISLSIFLKLYFADRIWAYLPLTQILPQPRRISLKPSGRYFIT